MNYPFDTRKSPLIEGAIAFCIAAHCAIGQKRKYTGEDYYHHPLEVAGIVSRIPHVPEEVIAAAVLHDVVEDTAVGLDLIRDMFGSQVATLVDQLTDKSVPADGNREARKALDRARTAAASPWAKTIKLADLISNTRSITAHDPKFAAVYLAEKRLLLEVLTEGDPTLHGMACELAWPTRGDA